MIPLHQSPWFTFRFADNRIISRFHLEGIEIKDRIERTERSALPDRDFFQDGFGDV